MPITPKFSMTEPVKTAQRFFTDRTEPRQTFSNALYTFDKNTHSVINFYGFGGIGKTRLLKELVAKVDNDEHWSYCSLNMSESSVHDCAAGTLEIRNMLSTNLQYKINFSSFDFAYAIYWQKLNPSIALNEQGFEQLQNSDLLNDIVKEVLGGLDSIPVMNIVPKIAMLAKKTNSVLTKWWLKQGAELFNQLASFTPIEIKERLPMFFARDIKLFLEKNPSKNICVFIDTYEALWENLTKEGKFFETDEWIRELISQLPEVLFVIAGREKLRWEEYESDWASVIDSHILDRLSPLDAKYFLEHCGILDSEISGTIIQTSEGVPFYLDLAVDGYKRLLQNGNKPKVENFTGKTQREVLDRFIRYLDREEASMLKVLALSREYDYELFNYLVKEFNTGYPATDMYILNRYSFIEATGNSTFSINPLMRKALIDHNDPEFSLNVEISIFKYYFFRIKDFATEGSTGFKNYIESTYYFHKCNISGSLGVDFSLLSGRILQYQCNMVDALEEFRGIAECSNSNLIDIQNAKLEIAITQRQNGDLNSAGELLADISAVALKNSFLELEGKVYLQQGLCIFADAQLNKKSQDYYQAAYDLYQKGIDIAERTNDAKQLIYAQITISTVMEELGLIHESIDLLNKVQQLAKENAYQHFYIDCLNGLARKYLLINDYNKAIEFSEKGLELWKLNNFYRGQQVMCSHLLKAHFHLGHIKAEVKSIIKLSTELDDIVSEELIKNMALESRQLWE